jgi:hypothetical protein
MLTAILWFAFAVILFLHTLRIHQTADFTDRIALVLTGLGVAVLIAAAVWAGPVHVLLMGVAGVVLAVVLRPVVARFAATFGAADRPVDAAERQRMGRLSRGEISLDEYFKEGDENQLSDQRRLAELAMQPNIAKVLRKHGISVAQFVVLRQSLKLLPDLEWQILGDPRDLEQLIARVAAGKSPDEIALSFRGRRRK